MALKFIVDTLDGLSAAERGHYSKADDGRFRLVLDGGHPDSARLTEFRDNNVKLTKERDDLIAKFDGIDPVAVKADRTKLAAFEQAKPDERIATLETQLATANRRLTESALRDAIDGAFLRAGGRPNAVDFIRAKAADKFKLDDNGAVVGTVFDPQQPGVTLTVDAFIAQQVREADFAFKPSSGSGADPRHGGGGRSSNVRELRNPDARALGQHAAAIARGEIRVVNDE